MDRSIVERLSAANSERILRRLTAQQHLHPTRSVQGTIERICREEGLDLQPEAVARLFGTESSIGRLSRQQVCQLAEQIEAAWQAQLAGRFQAHAHR